MEPYVLNHNDTLDTKAKNIIQSVLDNEIIYVYDYTRQLESVIFPNRVCYVEKVRFLGGSDILLVSTLPHVSELRNKRHLIGVSSTITNKGVM